MTNKHEVLFSRVCIIGMGLIGGSLAKAIKHAGICNEVLGCDSSQSCIDEATQLGVIDSGFTDVALAIHDVDIVVIAVPVGAMATIFETLADHLPTNTIVTDVGSTKRSVVEEAKRAFGDLPENFVPGHPLAGGEKNGVNHSFRELFNGCNVILTPLPDKTNNEAVLLVKQMWQHAGAIVFELGVERHDEVLGATSHLPHMLAYLLVDILATNNKKDNIFQYAAGGFRDFTRIASSDPGLWCDISLANRDVIATMLDNYGEAVSLLAKSLMQGDRDAINGVFTRAKNVRDHLVLS